MKILNVYFKNINSLAGENRIDFDKAPIADTGVFAITGPNGSGKSSILDAITLALYGETFRFNKPAENVMTRNTAMCFAQVEFLVSGEKYRSSWQVVRENNTPEGEVTAAQMQLLHVNGEEQVLAKEAHKVLSQNAELTGMDFRRFTRSIMLAQGDFAAFLNALDSERMDILERIISQDIYADYKQQIHLNCKQAEQQLAQLSERLNNSDLLSDSQLESAELDLADQKLSFADFKLEKTTLLQLQAGLQDLQKLEQRISQLDHAQTKAQQNLVDVQADLQQVSVSGEALQFKDALQNAAQLVTSLEQGKQQQKVLQQDLQQVKSQLSAEQADESYLATLPKLNEAIAQKKLADLSAQETQIKAEQQAEAVLLNAFEVQLPEKQKTLEIVDSWLVEHKKNHTLVESMPELGRLKNLRNLSVEIQKQLKTYNKAHKNSSSASVKNQSRLVSVQKEIAGGKKTLKGLQEELEFIADGHSIDEMVALHVEQKGRVADFTELLNLAKVHRKFDKKGFSTRFSHLDKTYIEKQLDAKNDQIDAAQNIHWILEKSAYREQLTIKLAADRDKLEDDTACPLCGSLEHPYAKTLPEIYDSRQALSDQSAIVKKLQLDAKKIINQLTAINKIDDRNTALVEQLNRVQTEWLTLCTRLNAVSPNFTMTSYRAMRSRIKKEKKELNEISILIQRYRAKKKEIVKLDVWVIKKQSNLEKRQAKQKELDESGEGRPQAMVKLEAELAENMQEESAVIKVMSSQLAELGEKLPSAGREDALYDLLSQRRQDFQSYGLRQKSLQIDIQQITEKVAASSDLLHTHGEKLQAVHKQLQELKHSLLYVTKLNKQDQLAEAEQVQQQLESDLKQIDSALQIQLQQSAYESLENVQALLDLHARTDEMQRLLANLQQELLNYPAEIEVLNKQLDAERVHVSGAETLESVVIHLREKAVQMEIVTAEIVTLEKKLAEQQQLALDNSQLIVDIEQLHQAVQAAQAELLEIEDEPEAVFRRRVQNSVADKLLIATNRFLSKINARYQVLSLPSEVGLAIEIVDSKQKNSRRALKSLSGGETFVVSLAMALGLSEIANNGRAIDSLFIDEGFGSLDAETLYTVLSTLENLKSQGKTVGIISHVEGIKLQIKTQLELVKQTDGLSRIVVQKSAGEESELAGNGA